MGLLVPRPYGGGGEPPSLDGRAAYRRRARWRPPGRARALATARARASAAASALVIALVRAGARVVLPFAAMVARMSCSFLVSSGTCSVRLVLMRCTYMRRMVCPRLRTASLRCMCGRAACAVCRRPAWRRGRRARAAHKYRSPAGGLFLGNGSYNSLAEQRALCAAATAQTPESPMERNQNKCSKPERSSGSSSAAEHYCSDGCSNATDATAAATGRCSCAACPRGCTCCACPACSGLSKVTWPRLQLIRANTQVAVEAAPCPA